MGKVIIAGGGGTGAGSDECTATRAELLKGYTAVTGDSDDEAVEGTLQLTGDASDSQVMAGKTYYNTNPKIKRMGSMVNQGAISQTLNAGESYFVPSGYHNGSGKVMANSLASQTPGNATAASIINGDTAWVNGNKITGNIASIGGQTINPTAYQQTVSSFGKYMTGNLVVNAVSNLSAANIKKGVNVGGTVGTFEGYVPIVTDLYLRGNNISSWRQQYPPTTSIVFFFDSGQITSPQGGRIRTNGSINLVGYNYVNVQGYTTTDSSYTRILILYETNSNDDLTQITRLENPGNPGNYTYSIPMKGWNKNVPISIHFVNLNGAIYRIWLS